MTKLTLRQRWRMTWELTWPLSLLDLAVVVVLHGMVDVQGETADSIWAVVAFFVVSPWVVRRALARRYGPLRVAVVQGAEERPSLSYQQSLKVMWLIAWRSLVLVLLAALLISAVLRFLLPNAARSFTTTDPLVNALGLSAVDALSSLAFTPLLIPGMLRKRFKGFHLELRDAAATPLQRP